MWGFPAKSPILQGGSCKKPCCYRWSLLPGTQRLQENFLSKNPIVIGGSICQRLELTGCLSSQNDLLLQGVSLAKGVELQKVLSSIYLLQKVLCEKGVVLKKVLSFIYRGPFEQNMDM